MWNTIENAISEKIHAPFKIEHKQAIPGGDINRHFAISSNEHQFFVKINDIAAAPQFEAEAYNLSILSKQSNINSSKVIALGTSVSHTYIVFNYINFSSPSSQDWRNFGAQLAHLHKDSQQGQFGWEFDNYIGSTLQPNPWMSNWRTFFAEQRIAWQLQLLHEKSINIGDIDHIATMCHDALQHHPTPSLLHGDLWHGNVGFCEQNPVIYDPACYYGDHEADLAMTELFGSFPEEFYQGYQSVLPISPQYKQRKLVYNFYHILNHANLFGGVYIEQSKALLKRIITTQYG